MPEAPTTTLQGIVVPQSAVNPREFFRATRRLTFTQKTFTFAGLGQTDNVPILQVGVMSELMIKVSGTVTVTLGGGTAATTARWPYDLIKAVRFSANGQSNLINVSGWKLKAREMIARGDLSDRGVIQGIGGASPGTSRQQGTFSLSNEAWGLGQNVSAIVGAPTVYNFELGFVIPVAFDQVNLLGAIFAQTSSTDLNLAIDWAPSTDLFVLAGAATAVVNATVVVSGHVFSIPQGPDGGIIVPDLSSFHSLIQSRFPSPVLGLNEIRFAGQGVGRQLLRFFWQVYNGSPGVPLPLVAANIVQTGWRFGGNDTPELFTDSKQLAYWNERLTDADLSSFQGVGLWDFASENAFRDSIDEGSATELRFLVEIASGVTLTAPVIEYVQETAFAGATGA